MSKNNSNNITKYSAIAIFIFMAVAFMLPSPQEPQEAQAGGEINATPAYESLLKEGETKKAEAEKQLEQAAKIKELCSLDFENPELCGVKNYDNLNQELEQLPATPEDSLKVEGTASPTQEATSSVSAHTFNEHEQRIIDQCTSLEMTKPQIAFTLANVSHETGKFKYFEEINGRAQALKLNYQGGENWYGRGYIQLTHKNNYELWSTWTGRDLVTNPDILVTDFELSAFIACSGIKHGSFTRTGSIDKYINKDNQDYYNARSIVNGDKNYRAGCQDGNCWTIGTKISDLSKKYLLNL